MQKRQRLTEIPYSSGTGCRLSADRHRSCVPQTPQAHLRAVCAEDTPLPALVCKAVADARHAETPATDGNPPQFGHWGPAGGGPNSTCDVGLPLGLTSGLGRDRGESGGLRGVLVAPARRREKLGRLFIGIVGSGCTRSRIMRLGLVRVRTVDIKGTGGITG